MSIPLAPRQSSRKRARFTQIGELDPAKTRSQAGNLLDDWQENAQALAEEVRRLRKEIEHLLKERQKVEHVLSDARTHLGIDSVAYPLIEHTATALVQKFDKQRQILNTQMAKNQSLSQNFREAKETLHELDKRLNKSLNNETILKNSIEEKDNKIKELEKLVTDAAESISKTTALREEKERLQAHLEKQKAKLAEEKQSSLKNAGEIRNLNERLSKTMTDFQKYKEERKADEYITKEELEKLQRDRLTLANEISALRLQNESLRGDNRKHIESLKQLEILQERITKGQVQLAAVRNALEQSKQEHSKTRMSAKNLQEQVTNTTKLLQQVCTEHGRTLNESDCNDLEGLVVTVSRLMSGLKVERGTLDELRRKVHEGELQNAEVRKKVGTMFDGDGRLRPLIGNEPVEIRSLHERFTRLLEEQEQAQAEKDYLRHSLERQKTELQREEKSTETLQKKVETSERQRLNNIQVLKGELNSVQTRHAAMRNEVQRLESAERNASAHIERLQQQALVQRNFISNLQGHNLIPQAPLNEVEGDEELKCLAALLDGIQERSRGYKNAVKESENRLRASAIEKQSAEEAYNNLLAAKERIQEANWRLENEKNGALLRAEALEQRLQAKDTNVSDRDHTIESLRNEVTKALAAYAKLTARAQQLHTKNDNARHQMAHGESSYHALQSEVVRLQNEQFQMKTQYESRSREFSIHVNDLKKSSQSERKKLSREIEDLQRRLEESENKKTRREATCMRQAVDLDVLKKDTERQVIDLQRAESRQKELGMQLEDMRERHLESHIHSLRENRDAGVKKLSEAETNRNRLQQNLSTLQLSLDAKSKDLQEQQNRMQYNKDSSIRQLRERPETEIAAYEARMQEKMDEHAKMIENIAQEHDLETDTLKSISEGYAQNVSSLNTELQEATVSKDILRKENQELTIQLRQLESNAVTSTEKQRRIADNVKQANHELTRNNQQVASLNQTIQALQASLTAQEQDKGRKIREYEERVNAIQTEAREKEATAAVELKATKNALTKEFADQIQRANEKILELTGSIAEKDSIIQRRNEELLQRTQISLPTNQNEERHPTERGLSDERIDASPAHEVSNHFNPMQNDDIHVEINHELRGIQETLAMFQRNTLAPRPNGHHGTTGSPELQFRIGLVQQVFRPLRGTQEAGIDSKAHHVIRISHEKHQELVLLP